METLDAGFDKHKAHKAFNFLASLINGNALSWISAWVSLNF